MNQLNYQHLYYFWMVAREGSIAAASRRLRLSSPTISVQIRQLEGTYEQTLFRRTGRSLELSEVGETVFRYADSIFSTGQELEDFLEGRRHGGPLRVDIGVAHALPKLVTWHLIEPVRDLPESCHIVCHEAPPQKLVEELTLHQLDVILSDNPLQGGTNVRLFNHLLGESSVSFFATPPLAERLRDGFPDSLSDADLLLPSSGSEMRRSLDGWFTRVNIHPRIVAEFDDLALLKVAGEHGLGVFPVPDVVASEAMAHYNVAPIGLAQGVYERFYAVSADRQIAHPAVVAIASQAPALFNDGRSS